jgi:hypothetical protein
VTFRYADTDWQTDMTQLFLNFFVAQRGIKNYPHKGPSAYGISTSNKHAAEDTMRPDVGFEAWPPGKGIEECHVRSVTNCGLPPEW